MLHKVNVYTPWSVFYIVKCILILDRIDYVTFSYNTIFLTVVNIEFEIQGHVIILQGVIVN